MGCRVWQWGTELLAPAPLPRGTAWLQRDRAGARGRAGDDLGDLVGDGDGDAPGWAHGPSSAPEPALRGPSQPPAVPGAAPLLAPRRQAQLAAAAAGCEAKGLQQQRCEPGARQPAEALAGPATVLTPGGESSCRDGAERTVLVLVTKAAGPEVAPAGPHKLPSLGRSLWENAKGTAPLQWLRRMGDAPGGGSGAGAGAELLCSPGMGRALRAAPAAPAYFVWVRRDRVNLPRRPTAGSEAAPNQEKRAAPGRGPLTQIPGEIGPSPRPPLSTRLFCRAVSAGCFPAWCSGWATKTGSACGHLGLQRPPQPRQSRNSPRNCRGLLHKAGQLRGFSPCSRCLAKSPFVPIPPAASPAAPTASHDAWGGLAVLRRPQRCPWPPWRIPARALLTEAEEDQELEADELLPVHLEGVQVQDQLLRPQHQGVQDGARLRRHRRQVHLQGGREHQLRRPAPSPPRPPARPSPRLQPKLGSVAHFPSAVQKWGPPVELHIAECSCCLPNQRAHTRSVNKHPAVDFPLQETFCGRPRNQPQVPTGQWDGAMPWSRAEGSGLSAECSKNIIFCINSPQHKQTGHPTPGGARPEARQKSPRPRSPRGSATLTSWPVTSSTLCSLPCCSCR